MLLQVDADSTLKCFIPHCIRAINMILEGNRMCSLLVVVYAYYLVPRLFIPDLASQFWKKSEKKVLDDFAREMVPL